MTIIIIEELFLNGLKLTKKLCGEVISIIFAKRIPLLKDSKNREKIIENRGPGESKQNLESHGKTRRVDRSVMLCLFS